jgi:isochorismate hydrolase
MSVQVSIEPTKAVLLVHDVVNDFLDAESPEYDPGLDSMLDNILTLLAAARAG